MTWKEEKPKTEGFYWFRGLIGDTSSKVHDFRLEPTVVKIHDSGTALYAKIPGENWWPLIDTSNGQWSDPLDTPAD